MRLPILNKHLEVVNGNFWMGDYSLRNLTNTSAFFNEVLGLREETADQQVDEDNAMRLSAVFSCIRVLSETAAQVPLYYYSRTQLGKEINAADIRNRLVNEEPNNAMDSFVFRETMAANLGLHGNAYAQILRDGNNNPNGLIPYHPHKIDQIRVSDDGQQVFYQVEGVKEEIPARNMLHFKILSKDGYIGRSFIDSAKEEIGGSLATQRFSNNFWKNGASTGMVIEVPHRLSQEGRENLKHSIQQYREDNQGKVLPLDEGSKLHAQSTIPQKDAQFLETKKFSKEQIAAIFRIPLPLINGLDDANYSNVTALTLNFAKYTMAPFFARIEAELNRKLKPRAGQGASNFFEHDMTSLMRGDEATRAQYYKDLYSVAAITGNEIRNKEGMNRLNIDGMDTPFKQKQDVPINKEAE